MDKHKLNMIRHVLMLVTLILLAIVLAYAVITMMSVLDGSSNKPPSVSVEQAESEDGDTIVRVLILRSNPSVDYVTIIRGEGDPRETDELYKANKVGDDIEFIVQDKSIEKLHVVVVYNSDDASVIRNVEVH